MFSTIRQIVSSITSPRPSLSLDSISLEETDSQTPLRKSPRNRGMRGRRQLGLQKRKQQEDDDEAHGPETPVGSLDNGSAKPSPPKTRLSRSPSKSPVKDLQPDKSKTPDKDEMNEDDTEAEAGSSGNEAVTHVSSSSPYFSRPSTLIRMKTRSRLSRATSTMTSSPSTVTKTQTVLKQTMKKRLSEVLTSNDEKEGSGVEVDEDNDDEKDNEEDGTSWVHESEEMGEEVITADVTLGTSYTPKWTPRKNSRKQATVKANGNPYLAHLEEQEEEVREERLTRKQLKTRGYPRREYDDAEDRLVIRSVVKMLRKYVKNGLNVELGGNVFWKDIEEKKWVKDRTWHSLRDHFSKSLMKTIARDKHFLDDILSTNDRDFLFEFKWIRDKEHKYAPQNTARRQTNV